MSTRAPLDFSVYVVTDPQLSKDRSHEEVVAAALEGGASVIQLRDKHASTRELCEVGLRLKALTAKWGALLIINDRVDVCMAIDADGVHLGQDDLPAAAARRLLGAEEPMSALWPSKRNKAAAATRGVLGHGKVVGVSTENGLQAHRAQLDGATYVAIGPIYEARGSKADAGEAIGPRAITELRKFTNLPIIAIGGIRHDRVAEVARAGADGAAVIRAIVGADDIAAATREMKRLFLAAKT